MVHKAVVKLNGEGGLCIVAIKTDKCKHARSGEAYISCLHTDAIRMDGSESFMNSEYMGSLLFQASRKARLDFPGVLPTWGIVQGSATVNGIDGSEQFIQGAVMPIVHFKTMGDVWKDDRIAKSSVEVAKLLLPVADALSFIERMGFSYQDIHEKNIGISLEETQGMAFAYDNTYLSRIEGNKCYFGADQEDACNYCIEDYFAHNFRHSGYTPSMVRRKDCHQLLYIVCKTLELSIQTPIYDDGLYAALDYMRFSGNECHIEDVANLFREHILTEQETQRNREEVIVEPSIDLPSQSGASHIYRKRNFPCHSPGKNPNEGFFFAKVPKTAGTTIAGVARRIALRKGRDQNAVCNVRAGHRLPRTIFDAGKREREKSFLFTFIRDPVERTISSFFYHQVSKNGVEPSDRNFLEVSNVARTGRKE